MSFSDLHCHSQRSVRSVKRNVEEEFLCVNEHAAHSCQSIACIDQILIVCLLLNGDNAKQAEKL